jgi:fructose 1,6-bisphosphatase
MDVLLILGGVFVVYFLAFNRDTKIKKTTHVDADGTRHETQVVGEVPVSLGERAGVAAIMTIFMPFVAPFLVLGWLFGERKRPTIQVEHTMSRDNEKITVRGTADPKANKDVIDILKRSGS